MIYQKCQKYEARDMDGLTVVGRTDTELKRQLGGSFYLPFLFTFILLQIADVITTNYALAAPGNWEVNPIMQLSQAKFGTAWWWTLKVPTTFFAALILPRLVYRWPVILVVSYYIIVVIGNSFWII